MSAEDDKAPPATPPEPYTEEAPAYVSEPPAVLPIDPWTELTPGDPEELSALTEAPPEVEAEPALPGFAPADAGPAEVTGAEVEAASSFADELLVEPAPAQVDDLAAPGPAAPPEWSEPSPPPEVVYSGDGPFAAPVDAPKARGASRFAEALRSEPAPDFSRAAKARAPSRAPSRALVAPSVKAELDKPHRLERRPSSGVMTPARTVGDMQRAAKPAPPPVEVPRRHYPKMRALLADPDAVPYGIEPPTPPALPPVPGTFFPVARAPAGRPTAVDLDEMLLTMAEGLLIGESADGGTEVRVTLKDEFFAGTELRIAIGDGRVRATLVPPDRDIYWQLNAHASDLEARLSDRGLRVASIEVLEPGA